MTQSFDIKKVIPLTPQDLVTLLDHLKGVALPDPKDDRKTHEYICEQMKLMHDFFVEKLNHQAPVIAHVITWMSTLGFLDTNSPEWVALNEHMVSVVNMADTCSLRFLAFSRRKAHDVTYWWSGRNASSKGHPYLTTVTNDTPDGIGERDPFVIFYGAPFRTQQ